MFSVGIFILYMSNIINETFKKHLQLLKSRLNESDGGGDSTTVAVGKFLDNVLLLDPRMYDIKNRDKVFNLVKNFLTSTKYGEHIDVSDNSVKSYVNSAMVGNRRWKASSVPVFPDREETSDMSHPYASSTTSYGTDKEEDDTESERKSWEKSSPGRLGYPKSEEDDFRDSQKAAYGVK